MEYCVIIKSNVLYNLFKLSFKSLIPSLSPNSEILSQKMIKPSSSLCKVPRAVFSPSGPPQPIIMLLGAKRAQLDQHISSSFQPCVDVQRYVPGAE